MRGVQILSVALVAFLGNSLAIPLGTTELSRPETSISGRACEPVYSKRDEDESGNPLKREDDEPGCAWKRDEDEPGDRWKRDEGEPGDRWKRDEGEPGDRWKRDTLRV